jgi:hypothetical protein
VLWWRNGSSETSWPAADPDRAADQITGQLRAAAPERWELSSRHPGQVPCLLGNQQIHFHPLSFNAIQVFKDKLIHSYPARIASESANLDSKQPRRKKSYVFSLGRLQHFEWIMPPPMRLLEYLKKDACVSIDQGNVSGREAPP